VSAGEHQDGVFAGEEKQNAQVKPGAGLPDLGRVESVYTETAGSPDSYANLAHYPGWRSVNSIALGRESANIAIMPGAIPTALPTTCRCRTADLGV